MSWIITLPKTVKWEDYEKELEVVADESETMYFKVPFIPKNMQLGDRCYLVWNGQVRGWMRISAYGDTPHGFQCSTTGKQWPPGKYIGRTGVFNEVDGPLMRGFQGIRKYEETTSSNSTS